jgi:hypothetical protein
VLQIGHEGPSKGSNDTTRLGRPADTNVDPATNEIFVADGYGNHRVIVFDADTGAYKRHWGAYGRPPTDDKLPPYDPAAAVTQQFGNPVHCVKLAKDGLVYVCDRINDRIQAFRRDGSFVTEWFYVKQTRGNGVWDLAIWPDQQQSFLFNADGENNEVRILKRADCARRLRPLRPPGRAVPLGAQPRHRQQGRHLHDRSRQRQARAEIPPDGDACALSRRSFADRKGSRV